VPYTVEPDTKSDEDEEPRSDWLYNVSNLSVVQVTVLDSTSMIMVLCTERGVVDTSLLQGKDQHRNCGRWEGQQLPGLQLWVGLKLPVLLVVQVTVLDSTSLIMVLCTE
jgi:hypothetical protein